MAVVVDKGTSNEARFEDAKYIAVDEAGHLKLSKPGPRGHHTVAVIAPGNWARAEEDGAESEA
jgi:hypothetical protein